MPPPDSDWSPLTARQVDAIAERAASKAIEQLTNHVYREIGRSVVQKATLIIGACAVGVWLWLKSNGYIK